MSGTMKFVGCSLLIGLMAALPQTASAKGTTGSRSSGGVKSSTARSSAPRSFSRSFGGSKMRHHAMHRHHHHGMRKHSSFGNSKVGGSKVGNVSLRNFGKGRIHRMVGRSFGSKWNRFGRRNWMKPSTVKSTTVMKPAVSGNASKTIPAVTPAK